MIFLCYLKSYRKRFMSVLRSSRVHSFHDLISKGPANVLPSHGCSSYVTYTSSCSACSQGLWETYLLVDKHEVTFCNAIACSAGF